MTLQQSISSALSHPCYGCIFVTISKPGDFCFIGSVSGLSWGKDCCTEGDIGTPDILHMEVCCREIRNSRKNPSSLLVHPSARQEWRYKLGDTQVMLQGIRECSEGEAGLAVEGIKLNLAVGVER